MNTKRLPDTHSQLIEDWDYEKNVNLKPEQFVSSDKKAPRSSM
jgi:hypothetical protein